MDKVNKIKECKIGGCKQQHRQDNWKNYQKPGHREKAGRMLQNSPLRAQLLGHEYKID